MGPDLAQALAQTADGMVAVDALHRIVGWNQAAAELFGMARAEVLGRPCCTVFSWTDRHGNAVCGPDCLTFALGGEGRVVANQEVLGRTKDGRRLWLQASTVVVPAEFGSQARLIHFLREATVTPDLQAALNRGSASEEAAERLTRREREVLTLLSEGVGTGEIARRLGIAQVTVRNHVQHVLEKLGVRSRAAAVARHLRSRV